MNFDQTPIESNNDADVAHANGARLFDENYYATGCGPVSYVRNEHWTSFFAIVADQLIRALEPRKVLDAGCALGFLVEAFWDRGIEAHGIDISEYAISNVRRDMKSFCRVGSIAEPVPERYDLITCIEVLEHIPGEMCRKAIESLCGATDRIFFSSSPSDVAEPTHVNVRPTIYWLRLFAEFGFSPDVVFDGSFVTPHAMLLRRGTGSTDSILPLFSELLRYKAALQAGRGRMSGLEAKIGELTRTLDAEQSRPALIPQPAPPISPEQIVISEPVVAEFQAPELQNEVAPVKDEPQIPTDVESELHTCLEENDDPLEVIAAPTHDESREAFAKELAELQAERDFGQKRIAAFREQVSLLNAQNIQLKHELNALAKPPRPDPQNVELTQKLEEQTQKLEHTQVELDAVRNSPGWRTLERYRSWLVQQKETRPLFFRCFDWVVVLMLRVSGGSRSAPVGNTPQDDVPVVVAEVHQDTQVSPPEVQASDPNYQRWIEEFEPGPKQLREQQTVAAIMPLRPLFSVIVPVYKVPLAILRACVDSVLAQTYDRWELCIADANDAEPANRAFLTELAARDERVRVRFLDENLGISGNSNDALSMAAGEFVAFLDHDDTLAPFALFEVVSLLKSKPETDLIYSDHDHIGADDLIRRDPLFKPAWSPEIMLSANYLTHLTVIRRTWVEKVGGFDRECDGAQDWDLFLKVTEATQHIEHIPHILYHWRVHPGSTAADPTAKSYAGAAQLRAIGAHLQRTGVPAEPEVMPDGLMHLRWNRQDHPLVSIIIPSKDNFQYLVPCLSSLFKTTAYSNYEILIVDNGSVDVATKEYYQDLAALDNVRVIPFPGSFNYSAANNLGARHALGKVLVFLNDDTEILTKEWLDELVNWAVEPGIGIVGGRLLRKDGTIQHAGVIVGLSGFAGHVFVDHPKLSFGAFGSTGWYRNFLAVTGACMAMRREVFDKLNGFEESFILCGSDVDICLRAWQTGLRVVYNPFAELNHYESQTRKTTVPTQDYFRSYQSYQRYLEFGDPFWNPNLSLWNQAITFRSKGEPTSMGFVLNYLEELRVTAPDALAPIPLGATSNSRTNEASRVVSWFDFGEDEVADSRRRGDSVNGYREVKSVIWFIPLFHNPFYGGIYTILRFADYWQREKGVRISFAICGASNEGVDVIGPRIRSVCAGVADEDIYILSSLGDVVDLPRCDSCLATLWTTAYFVLRFQKVARKFYFIQDFEPAFYKAGSTSASVESTYRFGFYGIANTISLRRTYETEYEGRAIHFTPNVNVDVFESRGRAKRGSGSPWQVFCYARPHHPRNAFELVIAAMRLLKNSLGNRVRIVSAGGDWDVAEYGLEGVIENLGVLPYKETAELYRNSDVGVALMLTRHPSYIPFELMATGCLVVTNKNHWTRWLLVDGQNCLLSGTSPSSLAARIETGLRDERLRERITATAGRLVREHYSRWPVEMERVYSYMCNPDVAVAEVDYPVLEADYGDVTYAGSSK